MAYMNQSKKKLLSFGVKAVLKRYGMKGTLSVRNHSTLVCQIKSGKLNFPEDTNVNTYHIDRFHSDVNREFLRELKAVMMVGNHDNSDIQTDYFDVGWYIDIKIGTYDKPYVQTS